MNKLYITSLVIALASFCHAQVVTQLDANNVNAIIADDGYFFTNSQVSIPGYEVPTGSNNHAIYTGSFWFGGNDINGQLKLAAQQYEGNGNDYYTGPMYMNQQLPDTAVANYFGQTIWKVSKAEIEDHIMNYQSSTYTMPNDISNWPAHGDTTLGGSGMLHSIAPFVDVNNNGIYDPANGDYPCIKGDMAVFTILNDAGLHLASFSDPVGMELHCMFYQYTTIPELEDVTFMDIEVVNMGSQTLYDTRATFFLDTDLGNYQDDYIGTDTSRNMVYVYNADDFDEPFAGFPGYGQAPPAVGLKLLSNDLSSSMSFTNGAPFPMGDPSVNTEFYQIMKGNYINGSNQLDGNGNPTKFTYTGDPNVSQSWSEYQLPSSPGDRRFVGSMTSGILEAGASQGTAGRKTFSYAIIYAKGTDHLNSVSELQSAADFVQTHYDNEAGTCVFEDVLATEALPEIEFAVYPNPSNGRFTVQMPGETANATLEILDAQGRKVHIRAIFSGENTIDVALANGIYFLKVSDGSGSGMKRLVVR